jgi:antitoxin HicB
MNVLDYPIQIERLPAEDGGGFAAYAIDLPGCMSDGETQEQAIENVRDAIAAWIEEAAAMGRQIPEPSRLPDRWAKTA